MKAALILLSLVLAACGTAPKPVVPDVPITTQTKQTITIEPALIAACAPQTKLDATKLFYTQPESVDAVKVWSDEYTDCSGRFAAFVGIVSKYLNINEDPNVVNPDPNSVPAASK